MSSQLMTNYASPEVERLIKKVEADEAAYDVELREVNREKIVLPVTMRIPGAEVEIAAFTRNISPNGVCVISPQPFSEGTELGMRLEYGAITHDAQGKCCWSTTFGRSYWVSGWLLDREFDLLTIGDIEEALDWESRLTDRSKVAVPIVVHQKNDKPRLSGFSRNLSGQGVCLIVNEPVDLKSYCLLEIVRCDGERVELVAECIWVRGFGDYFMCGFEFPKLDRIQKLQRSLFAAIER